MAGEQDDLQEHLSALLQWMISTNRVTVPAITAPSPAAEAAAPRALPAATAKKAAKTFRPMPATPEEAIAAGTSAMSARFLKEWKEEGYPGLPLRNPSPERQVAAAAAATATAAAAAAAAPAAGALKRTLDGAYSHSLYNKDMEGGGAAAAPPVPAAAAPSSSGSDGSKAAGRDDLVMGEAKEEAVAKKPRNSPVAEREPEVDTDLCEEPGCRSSVRYGPADPASSGTRCARHKTKGMVEKARRRKACDTCTSRKVKCDGGQPSCGPCTARHDECRYSTRLKSGPKPGFNSDASAARPAHPKEIAPAPPAVFGGPRSAAAVAAAAAAVAALTSAPLSMSRPSPATATSRASKLPASSSAGGASGSKGRELESPRALAAHALTGFRATGGSASAGGIWPVLGSSSLGARAAAGGPDGSKGAAAAAAGDLGGLAPLALAQLAAASPRLPLAMLGMLPAYGSLVGGLAGGSDGKTQQPPPPLAAAAAGAQGSPQTQQQQQQRRKQKQNLAFLQPSPTPAGASRSPSEGAVHHESRPAVAVAKSEATGDGADEQQLPDVVGGGSSLGAAAAAAAAPTEDAEREIVASSSSSSSMLLAAIAQDPALSAASAAQSDEAAAAAVEGVGAAAEGAVPAQELPLKSPSQGLNLLLFSQGLLQDAEGAARPASEIGEPMSPGGPAEREGVSDDGGEEGDEEGGAGMEVDDDPDPDPFPFFRKGPMRHPLRLRKSCDRCTMRKIKCDGTAVRCKRCEADGQYCHYSFKAKSGPKPNSPRKKTPTSPQKAAGAAANTEVPRFGQGSFAPLVPANRIHDTEAAAPTGSPTSIPAAAAAATVAVKKPPGCGHAEGVTQDMAGMTFQDLDQQRIVTPTAATPKAAAATAAAAAAAAAAMPSAIPTTTVQRTRTGRVAGKSPMPGGQALGAVERSGGAAAAAAARIGADSAGDTGGVAQGVFSSVAAAAATAAGGGAGDGPGGGPLDGTGAQNEGRQLSRGTGMVF